MVAGNSNPRDIADSRAVDQHLSSFSRWSSTPPSSAIRSQFSGTFSSRCNATTYDDSNIDRGLTENDYAAAAISRFAEVEKSLACNLRGSFCDAFAWQDLFAGEPLLKVGRYFSEFPWKLVVFCLLQLAPVTPHRCELSHRHRFTASPHF